MNTTWSGLKPTLRYYAKTLLILAVVALVVYGVYFNQSAPTNGHANDPTAPTNGHANDPTAPTNGHANDPTARRVEPIANTPGVSRIRSGPDAEPGGAGVNNLWCPCGKGYRPYNTSTTDHAVCDFCKTKIAALTTCFRCRLDGPNGYACLRCANE